MRKTGSHPDEITVDRYIEMLEAANRNLSLENKKLREKIRLMQGAPQ